MVFSTVAVLVACLGVVGLVSFQAQRQRRATAVRKVYGATVIQLVAGLSIELVALVAAASILAWPLAWWATTAWLQGFAYRTEVGAAPFLAAAAVGLALALVAVAWQAAAAAAANPADTLRNE